MMLHDNAPAFWRQIRLEAGADAARGEVMDNVHHFVVRLQHDGHVVTATTGEAIRVPWTTCPGAVAQLDALVGAPVSGGARMQVEQSLQCTHMLDTAKLAVAQIARGGSRRYDMLVRNGDAPDTYRASIARDGRELFEWLLQHDRILSPPAFAGHVVRGRAEWSNEIAADPDLREAALILRRCVFIFRSRPTSAPVQSASELPSMGDVCFSFQAARVDRAVRPHDFAEIGI